jgi:hypothetical protein
MGGKKADRRLDWICLVFHRRVEMIGNGDCNFYGNETMIVTVRLPGF